MILVLLGIAQESSGIIAIGRAEAPTSYSSINENIRTTFEKLDKDEKSQREIHKELGWLLSYVNQHINSMDAVHDATLLSRLWHSSLKIQHIAQNNGLINLCVERGIHLLSHSTSSQQFKAREITSIIQVIASLPSLGEVLGELLKRLVKKISEPQISYELTAQDRASILQSFAQLGINLTKYSELVKGLLKIFLPFEEFIMRKLELTVLSSLWRFCVYSNARIHDEEIEMLFSYVDRQLKQHENPLVSLPSAFQLSVSSVILNLLTDEAARQVRQEYVIGSYTLDIFLPEQHLNIEIDGPTHYFEQQLNKSGIFRDKLLKA